MKETGHAHSTMRILQPPLSLLLVVEEVACVLVAVEVHKAALAFFFTREKLTLVRAAILVDLVATVTRRCGGSARKSSGQTGASAVLTCLPNPCMWSLCHCPWCFRPYAFSNEPSPHRMSSAHWPL
jgi:hypothetical protein